jgi:hypothetical protein
MRDSDIYFRGTLGPRLDGVKTGVGNSRAEGYCTSPLLIFQWPRVKGNVKGRSLA